VSGERKHQVWLSYIGLSVFELEDRTEIGHSDIQADEWARLGAAT